VANPFDQFDTQSAPAANAFDRFDSDKPTALNRVRAVGAGFNRGVAGIAGLPVDTLANVIDLGKAGIGSAYTAITGRAPPALLEVEQDRQNMWGSAQNIEKLLNKAGQTTTVDRPDDKASRYLYAGGAALPAAATLQPGSAAKAGALAAQAFGVGTVPELAKDMGGGESAQMGATLGASILIPGAVGVGRAVAGAAQPLTEAGRRQIAGAAIRNAATEPGAAIRNLDDAAQFVPGSMPTAGQAARDPGIANFENRLRALNAPAFSTRVSQQNEARQKLLDTVARGGQPEAITALESRRDAITSAMRDKAMSEAAGRRVPTENILADIDRLIANPENAGQSVQAALRAVRRQIGGEDVSLGTTDGIQVSGSSPMTDARALYAVRKEINRVLEGKFVNSDEHVLRYAGGQLKQVRDSLDNAITEVAPSWKPYLTKYAQLSKPIERAKEVGSIRERTALAAPDIQTGRDYLSQPKWKSVVGRNLPELSKLLTKGQMQKMQMVAADLDRGAAATSSTSIRVPGSDTAANLVAQGQLSVANIIGRTLGKDIKDLPPALGTLTRPLAWVYKLPDDQVRTLIVDAMLDPKLAGQLMREGTRENIQTLADGFRRQAELSGVIVSSEMAR
jgi:predicted transcriptional regulator